jgi:hypothetical protein
MSIFEKLPLKKVCSVKLVSGQRPGPWGPWAYNGRRYSIERMLIKKAVCAEALWFDLARIRAYDPPVFKGVYR